MSLPASGMPLTLWLARVGGKNGRAGRLRVASGHLLTLPMPNPAGSVLIFRKGQVLVLQRTLDRA